MTFLENGGSLLGLAVGACRSNASTEDLELVFYDETTGVGISPTFNPSSEESPRSVDIRVMDRETRVMRGIFQEGERRFLDMKHDTPHVKIWARYLDGETEGGIAALCCNVGAGKAMLWGPNLEHPINDAEEERRKVMLDTLRELRLNVPSKCLSNVGCLPQFLTSHPLRPGVVSQIMEAITANSPAAKLGVFEDAHDTFNFHTLADGNPILSEARRNSQTQPCSANHPKHIIFCANGELPTREQAPLFNLTLYYDALSSAREMEGLPAVVDGWAMGEIVLYGETVTSTQTMFDK